MNPYVVATLVDQIKPLLAGHAPNVQGAALADLLAIWLVAHVVPGSKEETGRLRQNLLQMHVQTVEELIPVNEVQGR